MASLKKAEKPKQESTPPELEAFVEIRKRPAVFLSIVETLKLIHVVKLREELGNNKFDELDLVIQSGGGDIHAAYQIVELLRFHTKKFYACVPFFAKSAATLLCIGADVIFLDELAQLGPLDTQIEEKGKSGQKEYVSALNPFKAVEQMQNLALETLDLAMKMIISRTKMDIDDCFKHGIEFVKVTTGPLISQLNPEKLGTYSRALSIGEEYGKRLLRRFSSLDEKEHAKMITNLVHGYPSHEYIIDYLELKELGFKVELFKDEEREIVKNLFNYFLQHQKNVIRLITYSPKEDTGTAVSKKEEVKHENGTAVET